MKRVPALELLATNVVGDGGVPNLFFVSIEGVIITVTRTFSVAYDHWKSLPRDKETALEDRKWGVICSTGAREEGSSQLITIDDSSRFEKMYL